MFWWRFRATAHLFNGRRSTGRSGMFGGLLAKVCSRLRFRLRMLMVLPVLAAGGMAFWLSLAPSSPFPAVREIPLKFVVTDAASGQPIVGATVRVVDPFDDPHVTTIKTRRDGAARMTPVFQLQGE